MARSAVLSFDDPISYQTAIRPAAVEVFVAAKGSMRVQLAQIQFDKLWIQSAYENLPRVAHSALSSNRAHITFLVDANQPVSQYCGIDVSSDAIQHALATARD